jgi:hypothetical protein
LLSFWAGREGVDRTQPGPDEKLVALEEPEWLLQAPPDDLRRIVIGQLDSFTRGEDSITCRLPSRNSPTEFSA